ncbi:hypothetical protein RHGRI_008406 [Rhododendron griersonianum]|uniref:DEAD-box ATP-dependent RNA helicase 7 n=1 Tax=Rhododendron griersonianum TaxID=479676 RepID=A0AAV6L0A0_9ERIC|nr:hypothetical protein RHGRI_008406 [Rhododendron griersonianum]
MPSLALSEPVSSQSPKVKKKKMKADANVETLELDSSTVKKVKKEKKAKKSKASDSDSEEFNLNSKKKDKKRKAADIDNEEEEERSEASSELIEPVNSSKKKKVKLVEAVDDVEEGEEMENPNSVSKFRISAPLREMLKSKGIEALFPIQAMTFDVVLDGSDIVGRARTGQGKTLAFVLPLLESLTNGPTKAARKTGYGKAPSVLVLLPTRELAKQVSADFEVYGGALGLTSCCLYGGAPYQSQQIKLKRGVDIVVGTPGRIKDHIERGNIDLSSLKFRVLDEADEMLRMGFVEDVELILGKVEDVSKVQTLLFSATLPTWVKNIAARFLKPNKKTVDLVGNEKMKASTNVRHITIPCSSSARSQLIPDIIRCYSSGGRTIIFTETKDCASELADILPGARPLHGDIQQAQREVTLSGFRSGKFMTLVATNVAARGLDINDVQLIIQCEPPRDVEAYIHRSGRTGRAGNTGVAVMLYDPRRSNFAKIERESGVKFEHISAPQPADIAKAAGSEAAETITQVTDGVIPIFKSAAEELINASGLSPVELLAKALAWTAGYTEIKSRSLLTSMENHVTVHLEAGRPIYTPSFAYAVLRRFLPEEKVELVKGFSLTADGKGAVFDVPTEEVDTFLAGQEKAGGVTLEVVKELPQLQEKEARVGRFSNGGRGGGGGRFSGGRGGGFSDRRSGGFSRGSGGGRGRSNNKWRAKFAINSIRTFSSRTLPKTPIPISKTLASSHFVPKQQIPIYNPFLVTSKRHFSSYYIDRNQVHHFRPRGPRRWFQNPRTVLIVVLVSSGAFVTVYFGNLETVPYTKRKHFILLSKTLERQLGESQFQQMKASFKGKILPAIHPDSVRVRLIAKDVIEALKRGLRQEEKVWSDLGYAAPESGGETLSGKEETIMALSESGRGEVGKWGREDEILDDKWVEESRKRGKESGSRSAVSHLEGLNWEVGHAVARHSAEGITKNLWFAILQLILYQFVMPDLVNTMSTLFLRLPFSRRMEIEADYIGLLLVASAGYDPRVAPKVYEKLAKVTGESALRDYLSTHPSGKKRAQLLAQAKVMEEAMTIYREVQSGRGVEGFL